MNSSLFAVILPPVITVLLFAFFPSIEWYYGFMPIMIEGAVIILYSLLLVNALTPSRHPTAEKVVSLWPLFEYEYSQKGSIAYFRILHFICFVKMGDIYCVSLTPSDESKKQLIIYEQIGTLKTIFGYRI